MRENITTSVVVFCQVISFHSDDNTAVPLAERCLAVNISLSVSSQNAESVEKKDEFAFDHFTQHNCYNSFLDTSTERCDRHTNHTMIKRHIIILERLLLLLSIQNALSNLAEGGWFLTHK